MNTNNIFKSEGHGKDGSDKYKQKTTNESESGKNSNGDTTGQGLVKPPKVELIVKKQGGITEHLLSDKVLADSLNHIIEHGTKEISIGNGETTTVIDYPTRLKGIDMSLKLKGHYRETAVKNGLVDAIYKLE